jgi:prefoldin subunit 5
MKIGTEAEIRSALARIQTLFGPGEAKLEFVFSSDGSATVSAISWDRGQCNVQVGAGPSIDEAVERLATKPRHAEALKKRLQEAREGLAAFEAQAQRLADGKSEATPATPKETI